MNTPDNLTVRRQALWAFGIFAIPSVITFCIQILGICGIRLSDAMSSDAIQTFNTVRSLLNTLTLLIAFIILSRITTNRTTGVVICWTGIALAAIKLTSLTILFIRQSTDVSNIFAQLSEGILYLISILTIFYMFGALERNNPTCLRTKKAVLFLFWLGYILPMFTSQLAGLLLTKSMTLFCTYQIIMEVIFLGGYYTLMTSEAFAGRTDNSPAPKGAYKVWNRYFKYFLWAILGMAAVSILYLIVTEVILK